MCCLDQNTVSMALRRVFYSLSLSTLTHAGFYLYSSTQILHLLHVAINIEYTFIVCLYFMLNERKSEKAAGASPHGPTGGAYSAPPDPLAVTGGGTPPPVPTPACEYSY